MKYFISADRTQIIGLEGTVVSTFSSINSDIESLETGKVTGGVLAGAISQLRKNGEMPAKRKYTKKVATGEKRGRSVLSEEMKDDAVEWYEAGDGTDEIAEKLGVSRPTIVKALRERKVKMKRGKRAVAATDEDGVEVPEASEAPEPPKPYVPKISPERLDHCKRLLGKGETMADIATKTGLDESQVERIAVSMGL